MVSQRGVHGGPGHGANAIGLLEDGERAAACVEHGGAQLLAGQVGGLGDAALFQRHDRGGRVVVDHHHRHGLVLRVGVVGVELHHGGQIGKTHVVGARGHALHRAAGAVARIHRHVQACGLEVALGHGLQEQCGRAFKTPVELELDGRGGLCLGQRGAADQGQGGSGLHEQSFFHSGLLSGEGKFGEGRHWPL